MKARNVSKNNLYKINIHLCLHSLLLNKPELIMTEIHYSIANT